MPWDWVSERRLRCQIRSPAKRLATRSRTIGSHTCLIDTLSEFECPLYISPGLTGTMATRSVCIARTFRETSNVPAHTWLSLPEVVVGLVFLQFFKLVLQLAKVLEVSPGMPCAVAASIVLKF